MTTGHFTTARPRPVSRYPTRINCKRQSASSATSLRGGLAELAVASKVTVLLEVWLSSWSRVRRPTRCPCTAPESWPSPRPTRPPGSRSAARNALSPMRVRGYPKHASTGEPVTPRTPANFTAISLPTFGRSRSTLRGDPRQPAALAMMWPRHARVSQPDPANEIGVCRERQAAPTKSADNARRCGEPGRADYGRQAAQPHPFSQLTDTAPPNNRFEAGTTHDVTTVGRAHVPIHGTGGPPSGHRQHTSWTTC
jgi:hypothetical protein